MLDPNPDVPRFMDQSISLFRDIHRSCDSVYRELHKEGVDATVRHTAIFTPEEETKYCGRWEFLLLLVPRHYSELFYVGECFCIRGGDEQRKFRPSQFKCFKDPDRYVYTEHGSKNTSGGLAQLREENKSVPCYSVPDKVPQCLVVLLDLYLNKLPPYTLEDVLYCRLKLKVLQDYNSTWYDAVAVGKNCLGGFVKDFRKEVTTEVKSLAACNWGYDHVSI